MADQNDDAIEPTIDFAFTAFARADDAPNIAPLWNHGGNGGIETRYLITKTSSVVDFCGFGRHGRLWTALPMSRNPL